MNRRVAIKVMSQALVGSAAGVDRFRREVRAAAQLSHANIVTAHDADQDRGLWFLVMEYVDGTDLAHCVGSNGQPPLPIACEIIRQAALGLQHAHDKGMVHRDIKPANLMVTRAPAASNTLPAAPNWPVPLVVKILDFGLARLQFTDEAQVDGDQPVTREGTVIGTPEFMSPEQATDSRHVDIRSDIYSLGCTFYYLLAGRPPFVHSSLFEVLASQMKDQPPPLDKVRPDIHPGLAAIVNRMLAKRPQDRYQTPKEVARALKPWSQSSIAPSSGTDTIRLEPHGIASPYRETPRETPRPGTALPTLPSEQRSHSIGWLLVGMGMAIVVLLYALFIFRAHLPRQLQPGDPLPVDKLKDSPKENLKEEPKQPD